LFILSSSFGASPSSFDHGSSQSVGGDTSIFSPPSSSDSSCVIGQSLSSGFSINHLGNIFSSLFTYSGIISAISSEVNQISSKISTIGSFSIFYSSL